MSMGSDRDPPSGVTNSSHFRGHGPAFGQVDGVWRYAMPRFAKYFWWYSSAR